MGQETGYTSLASTVTLTNTPVAAPLTFAAVDVSSMSVDWLANNNPDGTRYEAQVSTMPDFTVLTESSRTVLTQATFLTLQPNTTYFLQIKAINASNTDSAYLQPGSTVTLAAIPQALPYTAVSTTSLVANWTRESNPGHTVFIAEIDDDPAFASVNNTSITLNASAYFGNLALNATYYARVKARNLLGQETGYVGLASTITLVNPPVVVDASFTAVNVSSVTVDWQSNSNPGGTLYEAEAALDDSFAFIVASSITLSTDVVFSPLAPNTSHFVRVRAVNHGATPSQYLSLGSTVTIAQPPAVLPFTSVSTYAFQANWDALDNPSYTRYVVEIDTASAFVSVDQTSVTYHPYAIFSSLAANATYYVRIKTRNIVNAESAYTQLGSTVTWAAQPGAAAIEVLGPDSLRVNWQAMGNGSDTRFIAEISSAGFPGAATLSSVTYNAAAVFTDLIANTTYAARVHAVNGAGVATQSMDLGPAVTFANQPATFGINLLGMSITSSSWRWLANSNPDGTLYVAEISTMNSYVPVAVTSSTRVNQVYFLDLKPNTSYFARVKARDHAGADSEYLTLGSSVTHAQAPTHERFSAISSTTLRVHWLVNDDPPDTLFRAQVSTSADFNAIRSTITTVAAYADFAGLGLNTQHHARVQAKSRRGVWSVFSVAAATSTAAGEPHALAQSIVDVTYDRLSVAWDGGGNPQGTRFMVEISDSESFSSLSGSSVTSAVTASLSSLTPNTTYFVRVKARSSDGIDSAYILLGSSITLAAPPTFDSYTQISSSSLRVIWNDQGNTVGTSYVAQAATDDSFVAVARTSQTFNSYADLAGLQPNQVYHVRVKAINTAGTHTAYGDFGSTVTAAAVPVPPPAVLFYNVNTTSMNVAWANGGNPFGTVYVTEISLIEGFAEVAASSRTILPLAAFTGLVANTTYYARVKAVNALNISSDFLVLGATSTLTAGISALPYSNHAPTALRANWDIDGNPPVTLYQCQVSTQPDFKPLASSLLTTGGLVDFTGLSVNTTYYGRVRPVNSNGMAGQFVDLGTAVTLTNPPAALARTYIYISTMSLYVAWDVNGNPAATAFAVEISTNLDFARPVTSSVTVIPYAEFDGLLPLSLYHLRIRSINHAGVPGDYVSFISTSTKESMPPKQPAGVYGAWGEHFILQWSAVTTNADNTPLSDLIGYIVERSSLPVAGWVFRATVTTPVTQWTDQGSIPYSLFYYRVIAMDRTINYSEPSAALASQKDLETIVDSQDGGLRVILPAVALTKAGSGAGDDLHLVIKRRNDQETGKVLTSYDASVENSLGGVLAGYQFAAPAKYIFKIPVEGGLFSTPVGAVSPARIKDTSAFYHNGAEWLRLGGEVDENEQSLTLTTMRSGLFATRQTLVATDFSILSVEPRKIFTPTGTAPHNHFTVRVDNPKDSVISQAAIYNLEGFFVSGMTAASDGVSYYWDGTNDLGQLAPMGVYIYQLQVEGKTFNGTVVLVK